MSKAIINPSSSDYVLYINWDGFAYEWYRLVNSSYEGTPHINSLLEDGVLCAQARTGVPSITGAMQQCLASGVWPADTGNYYRFFDAENNVVVQFARENKTENIAEAAVRHGISAAAVNAWYFENRGLFEGNTQQPYIKVAGSPGNFGQRADTLIKLINGEPVRTGNFCYVPDELPRFISIYADDIDTIAHNAITPYDYLSIASSRQEWYDNIARTIMRMDQDLGRIISALKNKGIFERTTILLTTDHGMVHYGAESKETVNNGQPGAITSLADLAASIAEIGLKHIGKKFLVEILPVAGMKAHQLTDIVIVPVTLQAQITFVNPLCHKAIHDFVGEIKVKKYYGAHLTKEELIKAGLPANYADLLISARPPYHFRPDPEGMSAVGGNHDSLDPQVQHTFTLLSGANIVKGAVYEKPVAIVDIAPTLARLLGFEGPSHAVGTALDDILAEHLRGPHLTIHPLAEIVYGVNVSISGKTAASASITINNKYAGYSDENGEFSFIATCTTGVNRYVVETAFEDKTSKKTIYVTCKNANK
ncbi:alkaline phosphatase family protein [Paenibacillus sp. GXUN7292]|uniref:alkaline phosphatase family protein n=1 Tax=Paenibacillus sp. GXUN7292 TaxID=3422499 RepID=UPI003D7EF1AF